MIIRNDAKNSKKSEFNADNRRQQIQLNFKPYFI